MDNSLARMVSTAGHPAVLMPAAAVIASPGSLAGVALSVSLACAVMVVAYSVYKVRRGDWAHVDASVSAERAEFNLLVGTALLLASGALWLADLHVAVPTVVGRIKADTTIALTMTGAAANQFVVIFIGRDADNASDTAAGDATVYVASFEYTTT